MSMRILHSKSKLPRLLKWSRLFMEVKSAHNQVTYICMLSPTPCTPTIAIYHPELLVAITFYEQYHFIADWLCHAP